MFASFLVVALQAGALPTCDATPGSEAIHLAALNQLAPASINYTIGSGYVQLDGDPTNISVTFDSGYATPVLGFNQEDVAPSITITLGSADKSCTQKLTFEQCPYAKASLNLVRAISIYPGRLSNELRRETLSHIADVSLRFTDEFGNHTEWESKWLDDPVRSKIFQSHDALGPCMKDLKELFPRKR